MNPKPRTRRVPTARATIAAAALCAAALLAPAAAQATVRYAGPNGSNSADCTDRNNPCHIERAIESVAQSGDEVVLIPSVYEMGSGSLNIPPNVNVHGEAKTRHTLITGFTDAWVVNLLSDGARLADVRVTQDEGGFGAVNLSSASTIERVVAKAETTSSVACQSWKGTIKDSVCWSMGANGYGLGTNLAGPSGTNGPTIRNVTAVGTGTGSFGVSYIAGGSGVNLNVDLRNVIADGVAGDVRAYATNGATGSTLSFTSSNFAQVQTNPGAGTFVPGTVTANNAQGNLPLTPKFVDKSAGDFHQAPESPTIDTGSSDGNVGTEDIDGQGRTQDADVDMGADEFIENHVRYADVSAAGPEPCLQADPCSLRSALEGNGRDGDEVIVGSGTYQLDGTGVDVHHGLDVHPDEGEPIELLADTTYALSVYDEAAVLSDLRVDNEGGNALFIQGGTVERSVFRTTDNGSFACVASRGLIRDSVCFSDGALNGAGAGLNYSGGNHAAVLRNVTAVATGTGGDGLSFGGSGGAVINVNARNVIAEGTEKDVLATSSGSTTKLDIDNSNYSEVQWGGTDTSVPDPGTLANQTEEPLFADLAAGDFHQLETSPTVDNGAAADQLGATDLDGETRTSGSLPDIGADEYQHPPVVTPDPPDDGNRGGNGALTGKKCKRKGKGKKGKPGAKKKRCKKRKRP